MTLDEFLRQFGAGLGGGLSLVGLGVVFLAGIVASAVCPCTLPVGLGMASAAGASEAEVRRSGLKIASAFFAGIVINLTLLGALTGRLGALATERFGRWWALGMAILSLAAAVLAFWGPRFKVSQLAGWRRPGLTGAFGYGFLFSLGTSVAPLLLLLTVSAAKGSPATGLILAFTFGLGRGLPFLLAGVVASAITGFTRLSTWRRTVQVISGCALLLVSGYYANTFAALL
ncbi:MAG: thiol:disulfide interchange protein [Candidatus Rokubacteria bacterium]|nr:thiol:disulfide interchange protein [Candidatus Rokubacteria bacterium]MBI4589091.1 thiol:disulfide interchange protein [Candidatus Rokubacteria bacterium]